MAHDIDILLMGDLIHAIDGSLERVYHMPEHRDNGPLLAQLDRVNDVLEQLKRELAYAASLVSYSRFAQLNDSIDAEVKRDPAEPSPGAEEIDFWMRSNGYRGDER